MIISDLTKLGLSWFDHPYVLYFIFRYALLLSCYSCYHVIGWLWSINWIEFVIICHFVASSIHLQTLHGWLHSWQLFCGYVALLKIYKSLPPTLHQTIWREHSWNSRFVLGRMWIQLIKQPLQNQTKRPYTPAFCVIHWPTRYVQKAHRQVKETVNFQQHYPQATALLASGNATL